MSLTAAMNTHKRVALKYSLNIKAGNAWHFTRFCFKGC